MLVLKGVIFTIEIETFYHYKLNLDNDLNIDFANLLKKALGLLKTKKKLVNLVLIDKKSEDLVNKYEKKTQVSFIINHFMPLPESTF